MSVLIEKESIAKEFFQVTIPAFISALGMGLFFLVDSVFIGVCLSDDGLAAVGVAWNLVIFLTALAQGIGMAGSIRYSIALGKGQNQEAKKYLTITLVILGVLCVLLSIVYVLYSTDILIFLGAKGIVLSLAQEYIDLIAKGVFIQVTAISLLPIVRNIGGHKVAGIAMTCGYLLNIFLDYLLMIVYKMGMKGCSIAFLCGQLTMMIPCVVYLIMNKSRVLCKINDTKENLKEIIQEVFISAISPSGLMFSANIVLAFISYCFLTYGNSQSLATFIVIMSSFSLSTDSHRGITDGCQPLLSRYYGEGNISKTQDLAKMMYIISLAWVGLVCVFLLLFKTNIADLYQVSQVVADDITRLLPYCIICYLFISFSRTTITYMYAISRNLFSGLLTYGYALVAIITLLILPVIFGVDGIWMAINCTYVIMGCFAGYLLTVNKKINKVD